MTSVGKLETSVRRRVTCVNKLVTSVSRLVISVSRLVTSIDKLTTSVSCVRRGLFRVLERLGTTSQEKYSHGSKSHLKLHLVKSVEDGLVSKSHS